MATNNKIIKNSNIKLVLISYGFSIIDCNDDDDELYVVGQRHNIVTIVKEKEYLVYRLLLTRHESSVTGQWVSETFKWRYIFDIQLNGKLDGEDNIVANSLLSALEYSSNENNKEVEQFIPDNHYCNHHKNDQPLISIDNNYVAYCSDCKAVFKADKYTEQEISERFDKLKCIADQILYIAYSSNNNELKQYFYELFLILDTKEEFIKNYSKLFDEIGNTTKNEYTKNLSEDDIVCSESLVKEMKSINPNVITDLSDYINDTK